MGKYFGTDGFRGEANRTLTVQHAFEIGRFIYLMDASMDYEKDKKNQNYNPLFHMKKHPEEMQEILEIPIEISPVLGNLITVIFCY